MAEPPPPKSSQTNTKALGASAASAAVPFQQLEEIKIAVPEPEPIPPFVVVQPIDFVPETTIDLEDLIADQVADDMHDAIPDSEPVADPEPIAAPIAASTVAETRPTLPRLVPRRVLSEDDPVLSYLDSVAGNYVIAVNDERQAPLISRVMAGLIDLICVAALASPFALVLDLQEGTWHDPRVAGIMTGIVAVVMFIYLTVSTALTGRTLGLKLLSLRAIDARTGLIPTGSQAAARALVYVCSLATLGLGFLVAAINPERKTVHDRVSRTLVVKA